MTKIIIASLEKIDIRSTLENVRVIESVDQLKNAASDGITYVLATSEEQMKVLESSDHEVYIPAFALTAAHQHMGQYVYFDLESYPFYQKVKEVIGKEQKPKGVLRFRRIVKHGGKRSLLAGDLYVLSSLLGKPQDVQVKQTNLSVTPSHTIIMINFGGGTMAHIEYTVADQEKIELEWSGILQILEFDSEQMKPIQSTFQLRYSVDAILASARKVNQELIVQLNDYSKLINGGAPV
ncbi:hypothetical protein [Sporosarcina sp. NPDC096371]|uniref:hypothetical protein n=1 Tax=Sporosarcina sp. NPDC096371 TaxID=3364530 RepID=UPI0038276C55